MVVYFIISIITTIISIGLSFYVGKTRDTYINIDKNGLIKLYKDRISILITVVLLISINLLMSKFGFNSEFLLYSALLITLITISIVDIQSKIISNRLLIVCICLGVISNFINNEFSLYSSLLGALAVGGILLLISIITKGGLGMGDVKLFSVLGFFFGLERILAILLLSTFITGILSLILLTFKLVKPKTNLPFAPFIYISTLVITLLNW